MAKFSIEEIRQVYSENAGPVIRDCLASSRFPYTYHHDYVRSNVPGLVSRSDVASAICKRFPDEDAYLEETVQGAFAYIIKEYAYDMLSDLLVEGGPASETIHLYQCMKAHADKCDTESWAAYFESARKEA